MSASSSPDSVTPVSQSQGTGNDLQDPDEVIQLEDDLSMTREQLSDLMAPAPEGGWVAVGHPGLVVDDEQARGGPPGELVPMYWADDPGGEVVAYLMAPYDWVDKAWAEDPANADTLDEFAALGQQVIDATYNPTAEQSAAADEIKADFDAVAVRPDISDEDLESHVP